jgi:hypothetical protein
MALHRRLRTLVGAAHVALAVLLGAAGHAQEAVYDANQVKAAFLYHFGTYVQWPDSPGADPVRIAVLGEPAVEAQLASFLPGRTIQGRPVEVVGISALDQFDDHEILFVGRAHNERLEELLSPLAQTPTLVVTDARDGLERGAVVNFLLVDSRVRFEISLPRAEQAGLALSSRLLSAAMRVEAR